MSPLYPSEIDYSKIAFDKFRKKEGSLIKSCHVSYEGHPFDIVPASKILIPFGISDNSKWNNKPDDVTKYHLELSLDVSDKHINEFRKFLQQMDEENMKHLSAHSEEIFGDKNTIEEIKKHKKILIHHYSFN